MMASTPTTASITIWLTLALYAFGMPSGDIHPVESQPPAEISAADLIDALPRKAAPAETPAADALNASLNEAANEEFLDAAYDDTAAYENLRDYNFEDFFDYQRYYEDQEFCDVRDFCKDVLLLQGDDGKAELPVDNFALTETVFDKMSKIPLQKGDLDWKVTSEFTEKCYVAYARCPFTR